MEVLQLCERTKANEASEDGVKTPRMLEIMNVTEASEDLVLWQVYVITF